MREIKTRVTEEEYQALQEMAKIGGYRSVYDLLRGIAVVIIRMRNRETTEDVDDIFDEVIKPDQNLIIRKRK